jgi:transposase
MSGHKMRYDPKTLKSLALFSGELLLSGAHHYHLGGAKIGVQLRKDFQMLLTTPGIGLILGLTIMLEVGDIARFPKVGNYSSYCRCVESKRISNNKKKGENNKKNGNRYLAWAYVEAANHAIRVCPKAQKFFQRKMAKGNRTLAIKALANKLSKATYFIMRDQVPYDAERLFR